MDTSQDPLRDLLEANVRALVDDEQSVRIDAQQLEPHKTMLTISCADADVGKVVGSRGEILGWLRGLTSKQGGKVRRQIVLGDKVLSIEGSSSGQQQTRDAAAIVVEFLQTVQLNLDQLTPRDARALLAYADQDAGDVRAYVLAYFGRALKPETQRVLQDRS